jgi:hypothetical protein
MVSFPVFLQIVVAMAGATQKSFAHFPPSFPPSEGRKPWIFAVIAGIVVSFPP